MVAFVKSIFFFPMMFLRGILQWLLRLFSGIYFFGGTVYLIVYYVFDYGDPELWYIPWVTLLCSFVMFLVGWFYDMILLKLNPDPSTALILD